MDVIVGADGSIYISDDVLNVVYRVTYGGASSAAPVPAPVGAGTGAAAPTNASDAATVRADGAALRFDPATLTLPAQQPDRVTFGNSASLQHNWVLVPAGQE